MEKEHKFKTGGLWDESHFWLIENCEINKYQDSKKCKHSFIDKEGYKRDPDYTHSVPISIVAQNQGGHDSTGVCADCAIEAIEKVRKGLKE